MALNRQNMETSKPQALIRGLLDIEADRNAALEAAGDAAYTSRKFLLRSVGVNIDPVSEGGNDQLGEDIRSLAEIFPEVAVRAQVAAGEDSIGPVEVPFNSLGGENGPESYIGGLLLVAQAWDKPVLARIDDINVRITPDATREEAVHTYHENWNMLNRPL